MHKNILKRKEKIIIAAIDLFDEAGINGLTTKEIARRQNITEPAVYKQFNSKKDILIAILDRCSCFDELIINTILDNKITGKEGIFYFVKTYAEYYQNYPQITTAIFSFDMFRYDIDLHEKMRMIISQRANLLLHLVTTGIAIQDFSKDVDKQGLTDALFGIIWSITFTWKMNGCNFDLKERMMKATETILCCL